MRRPTRKTYFHTKKTFFVYDTQQTFCVHVPCTTLKKPFFLKKKLCGCLVGWSVGRSVGCLLGWLVGWFSSLFLMPWTPQPWTHLPRTPLTWTPCLGQSNISFFFSSPDLFCFRGLSLNCGGLCPFLTIENVFATHRLSGHLVKPQPLDAGVSPGPPSLTDRTRFFPGPPPPGLPPNHTPTHPNPPWWNTGVHTSWTHKFFFF